MSLSFEEIGSSYELSVHSVYYTDSSQLTEICEQQASHFRVCQIGELIRKNFGSYAKFIETSSTEILEAFASKVFGHLS